MVSGAISRALGWGNPADAHRLTLTSPVIGLRPGRIFSFVVRGFGPLAMRSTNSRPGPTLAYRSVATIFVAAAMLVCESSAIAQQAAPDYLSTLRTDRWTEDWSWVDKTEHGPPFKSISLGDSVTASFGADTYLRYELKDPLNFGATGEGPQGVFLGRVLVNANVQVGKRARLYAELGAWTQSGKFQSTIFDEANLAVQRAFVDYKVNDRLQMRIGRQDIFDRSSRLLRAADALNYQPVFDAVVVEYSGPTTKTEFYYAEPFLPQKGFLQRFKGLGDSRLAGFSHRWKNWPVGGLSYAAYGVWQDRDRVAYLPTRGSEKRATAIVRATYSSARTQVGVEVGRQFGKVGETRIAAWAFAADWSRTLGQDGAWAVSLRIDGASGDRSGTATNESWAPIFPAMFFLGRSGIYNPSNAIGFYPEISRKISRKLSLSLSGEEVWRASRGSAFAAPGGLPLVRAGVPGGDHVLRGGTLELRWKLTPSHEVRAKAFVLEPAGAFKVTGAERLNGVTLNLISRF